jgi:redox-sensitive bicupin YhaK (pirin superfamily)
MTMWTIRQAQARGHAQHGWLTSWHSFSFANYLDPAHMHFSALRVINEDIVAPGSGFGMHPHRDMEIITVILSGVLEHQDSMGNKAQIRPGLVQYMSAGTGVLHSEYNPSTTDPVHLLQIWLTPNQIGLPPAYEERRFDDVTQRGRLQVVASPDGRAGSFTIRQDASLMVGQFGAGDRLGVTPEPGRSIYIHLATGEAAIAAHALQAGDALMAHDAPGFEIEGRAASSTVLIFDLPPEA